MRDKKYLVKVYKSGVYAGTLPYVVDDYQFTQDINTSGSEITVKLGTDLKGAGITTDVDYLVDKSGNHITDENGNRIITRKDYVFNTVPVDIGNGIDIWLYYSGNSNAGQRIFSGVLTSWEADEEEATITVTALSWGVQLDNYPIQILPGGVVLSYPTYSVNDSVYADASRNGGPYNRLIKVAQTFQVTSSTSISAFNLWVGNGGTFSISGNIQLYSGTPGGTMTLLASGTRSIPGGTSTPTKTKFTLITPAAVNTSTTYSWVLTVDAGVDASASIGRDSTGSYSAGQAYSYNDTTAVWATATGDYAFEAITSSGSIGNQFNSYDPGAIIVSLLDSFTNAGGIVDCDETSVDATGTVVSYTFKYNTVLDGIKKCLELAPPNWYWYVDIGTNVVHFHRLSLTPNHTFIKGQHIGNIKPKYSIENIKNRVIFSGGENPSIPGVNIVSDQSNSGSILKYGQWLSFDSDNRVTTQSTADLIVNNTLGEFASPQFTTTLRVYATKYDIETINVGNAIAFRNANDLVNSLVLQVVSRTKTPDYADLTLATLPPSQTHRIEDIKRNLDAVITANNPAQ